MKKSGASPSVILDRTILMWLSFYRGRRRPGDIKKESFFQPQPFFLAAKAAKRSLEICIATFEFFSRLKYKLFYKIIISKKKIGN